MQSEHEINKRISLVQIGVTKWHPKKKGGHKVQKHISNPEGKSIKLKSKALLLAQA